MVMLFFSPNTNILSFVLTGYGFVLSYIYFIIFSIARPLNARLHITQPQCCIVLKNMYQVMMSSSCKNHALEVSPHFDIDHRIAFAFAFNLNYYLTMNLNHCCHDILISLASQLVQLFLIGTGVIKNALINLSELNDHMYMQ